MVSEFGAKEPVLNIFLPLNIYRLILVEINKGNSMADSVNNLVN